MVAGETPPDALSPVVLANEPLVLDLRDLLPDSGGEIVIHDGGLGLTVSTGQTVTACGTAASHVTASGEDVSGYRYYQLDSGITLYCQADATLRFGWT